jgi:hypothetical protein
MFVGSICAKPSRDFTHLLGKPSGFKGLLQVLNANVFPTKGNVE